MLLGVFALYQLLETVWLPNLVRVYDAVTGDSWGLLGKRGAESVDAWTSGVMGCEVRGILASHGCRHDSFPVSRSHAHPILVYNWKRPGLVSSSWPLSASSTLVTPICSWKVRRSKNLLPWLHRFINSIVSHMYVLSSILRTHLISEHRVYYLKSMWVPAWIHSLKEICKLCFIKCSISLVVQHTKQLLYLSKGIVEVQKCTHKHEMFLHALLVWIDVEEPKCLVLRREHNSNLLL